MAKSIFINGTRVLSKWLNSIYGGGAKDVWAAATVYAAGDVIKLSGGEILRAIAVTGDFMSGATQPTAPGTLRGTVVDNNVTWELFGGHLHDGLAIDGSAPKVHPALEVLGETFGHFNVVFANTQFAAEQTIICYWRKHIAVETGGPAIVEIAFPYLCAQAHASGTEFVATGFPLVSLGLVPNIPGYELHFPVHIINDGREKPGLVRIGYDGSIDFGFYLTVSGDADSKIYVETHEWAAGAVDKGFYPFTIRYPIWP